MTEHNEQTTTPELPPEVFAELLAEAAKQRLSLEGIARLAYAAGADAELEACCAWLEEDPCEDTGRLRAARRPKPPSPKEKALSDLDSARRLSVPQLDGSFDGECILLSAERAATIRRALESLPD